jgi:LysM repeat protein
MIKVLIFIGFSFFNSPAEQDSIGVETVNGKVFVIHRVEEKETLYAISRRYGSSVDLIRQYNASAATGLEVGQILKIPYTPKATSSGGAGLVHKVTPKETLFSISKIYGVSTDELKQWNNLTDNSLTVGQELVIRKKNTTASIAQSAQQSPVSINKKGTHIVAEKETMYAITRQYGITVDQLKEWNNLPGNELKIGQVLNVSPPEQVSQLKKEPVNTAASSTTTTSTSSAQTSQQTNTIQKAEVKKEPVKQEVSTVQEQTIRISESVKNGDEIVQAGLAELIEGTEGNRKYLALHRTAPIGTILKIRNEMNNREVFVRVMGKLPDTALTDKVIIRVSKSAYDRLGAIDPKFRVEVTYYK